MASVWLLPGVLIFLTSTLVLGQRVSISSSSKNDYLCTNEVVVYTCSGTGNSTSFLVDGQHFFARLFSNRDPVPTTVSFLNNDVILTLLSGMPNYTVNVQIRVSSGMNFNLTCGTSVANSSNTMPVINEAATIQGPTNVEMSGLTGSTRQRSVRVEWQMPESLQFSIQLFIVNINVDGTLFRTGNITNTNFEIEGPSGRVITADVSVMTRCGTMSPTVPSINSVSGVYSDFYAGFLVPTFLLLIVIIVAVVVVVVLVVKIKKSG